MSKRNYAITWCLLSAHIFTVYAHVTKTQLTAGSNSSDFNRTLKTTPEWYYLYPEKISMDIITKDKNLKKSMMIDLYVITIVFNHEN